MNTLYGGFRHVHSLNFRIHEWLAEYVANQISLRVFEDWFFPETWDIDDTDNQELMNLVYGIKLRLAEFSHGDWTETELRQMLRSISTKYTIVGQNARVAPQSQIQYGTSSINYKISMPVTYSGQLVDIKPLGEPV